MAPPSSLSPRDLRKLRCAKFWLVATGTFWGISMQLIVYEGAGHPMNQLPNIPWYCSFLLVYAVTWFRGDGSFAKGADLEPVRKHQCEIVAPVGLLDWFGTTGLNVGLILSGSAIFGIIYASVTIWTALFAFCLLKKGLTPLKVVGIALVVVGLVLPALEDNDDGDGDSSGDLVGVGIGLTTAATLFYALEYVWCERAFHRYRIDGTELCFWSGIYGLGITLVDRLLHHT
jgi:drug/metabolite transporter (DMT)-like permease